MQGTPVRCPARSMEQDARRQQACCLLAKYTSSFAISSCSASTPTLFEHIQELPHTFDKDCIYLDEKKLSGPLRLRRWKKGDKIASLGVKGSQLVSKILHNAKVPAMERENYYVLSDDLQIHWCPRFKIGRNALATEESNQIIKCSITYKECAE